MFSSCFVGSIGTSFSVGLLSLKQHLFFTLRFLKTHATMEGSSNSQDDSQVSSVLQQVLEELKVQRSEINSLRNEVKDSNIAVKSEVAKLKDN